MSAKVYEQTTHYVQTDTVRRSRSLFAFVLASLAFSLTASATIIPSANVRYLENKPTDIIIGTVSDVQRTTVKQPLVRGSEEILIVTMANELTLKGSGGNQAITIEYHWHRDPDTPLPEYVINKGDHLIAFLVKREDKYTFTQSNGSIKHASVAAIALAAASPMDLEGFLIASLGDKDPAAVCDSLHLLHEMTSERAISQFVKLSTSSDPLIRATAIACGLKAGNGDCLPKAVEFLGQAVPSEVESIKSDIIMSIAELKDKKCLPILHKLLSEDSESQDHESVRRASIMALRKIASAESVPYLIRLLDDKDDTVRYLSVLTLNAVLGQPELDGKLLSYTRDNYGELVNAWKIWWQSEDAAKYKTAQ